MPRGRPRRRVSNLSQGARKTSSSVRSTSSTAAAAGAFNQPRRRSARLSALTAAREDRIAPASPPSTPPLLAEPSFTLEGGEPYQMAFVIQPRPSVRTGSTLFPPLIVAVQPRELKRHSDAREIGNMGGVWAFASLVTDDATATLAPPRTELLIGRTADSIHIAPSQPGSDHPDSGYAVFSDLAITQPGRYRIRVSLIDMDSNGSLHGQPLQGGRNLQSVVSTPITVQNEATSPTAGEDATAMTWMKLMRHRRERKSNHLPTAATRLKSTSSTIDMKELIEQTRTSYQRQKDRDGGSGVRGMQKVF